MNIPTVITAILSTTTRRTRVGSECIFTHCCDHTLFPTRLSIRKDCRLFKTKALKIRLLDETRESYLVHQYDSCQGARPLISSLVEGGQCLPTTLMVSHRRGFKLQPGTKWVLIWGTIDIFFPILPLTIIPVVRIA